MAQNLPTKDRTFIQHIVTGSPNQNLYQGAIILLMTHQGHTVGEIAALLKIAPAVVDEWIDLWNQEGTTGLARLKVQEIEPRLRLLLPADLHTDLWADPSVETLERVFVYLRTLLAILYDYVPSDLKTVAAQPGLLQFQRVESALMFIDLVGFTPLIEAASTFEEGSAEALLQPLNQFFATTIEVVTRSHGHLLEFTGDAMLAQFPVGPPRATPDDAPHEAIAALHRAIRAGLRLQRAMQKMAHVATRFGQFDLAARIGIHYGSFLVASIGTPRRMERILLGKDVHRAKIAEANSQPGRVCISDEAYTLHHQVEKLATHSALEFEPHEATPDMWFVQDTIDNLGDAEWVSWPIQGRRFRPAYVERSLPELVTQIEKTVQHIEPLASYLPISVFNLLVAHAEHRAIPHDFSVPTVVFVNVFGFSEAADFAAEHADPFTQLKMDRRLLLAFSRLFSNISAIIDRLDGTLKKVTHHLRGSDIMIFFGVPTAHSNDPVRAAQAAIAIRDTIAAFEPLQIDEHAIRITCRIGISRGPVFAAEIGQPQGRREFNIIGDEVNIAARLMGYCEADNQILFTGAVREKIDGLYAYDKFGEALLKGKSESISIYELAPPSR
ncbi:MAG: helix-turn-helix domain-containing protein [Anaerolineae bacterium]|nr:helix-turn-helix domain-containing protein [Anaerolineae bacterium]